MKRTCIVRYNDIHSYRYFDGVTLCTSIYNKLSFSVFICQVQHIGISVLSSHIYKITSYFALGRNHNRNIPRWFFVGVGDLDLGGDWSYMDVSKHYPRIQSDKVLFNQPPHPPPLLGDPWCKSSTLPQVDLCLVVPSSFRTALSKQSTGQTGPPHHRGFLFRF